ncbi:MAG: DUF4832 domain-containing protein [Roseburia sp.]|nr:DUF4832 domain-containing protein [Roseburia sp.]MCM1278196.1 DUF4832 domain-containing protein [Robinsoniella sp.]
MKKRMKYLLVMIVFVIIGFLVLMIGMSWQREVRRDFQEGKQVLQNPDRGFYIQVNSADYERIPELAKEVRVILLAFHMDEYIQGDIAEEKLGELRCALDMAGKEHVAVVFRASYGFHDEVMEPGRIEQMGRHIEQISQILNEYEENILVVQAGMLGEYGEWHSSVYLEGNEEAQKKSRLYILGQWETYLNPGIKVAVRRPRFIREAMAANILKGRLSLHNDALLSTDSDMGTYDDPDMGRMEELEWMENALAEQVNGGEMPTPEEWSLPENADKEFGLMHVSYLNLKYNEAVIERWSKMSMDGMNAKDYLENHLGYRLVLSELAIKELYFEPELSMAGVQMHIKLCNTGYGAISSKYKVFLSLDSGREQIFQEIQMPELYGISNARMVEKKIAVKLPKEFLQGSENIVIGLKIAGSETVENERDCVELANEEFLYQNGINEMLWLQKVSKWLYQVAE